MPRPLLALAAAVVLLLTAGLAIGLAHELLSPGPAPASPTRPGPARPVNRRTSSSGSNGAGGPPRCPSWRVLSRTLCQWP